MEEILASIRRIIADDDASKSTQGPEAAKPVAPVVVPVAPPPPPPPAPVAPVAVAPPERSPMADESLPPVMVNGEDDEEFADVDEQPADILELTESMAAPMPTTSAPRFRTIDSSSDLSFDEIEEKPVSTPVREAAAQLLSAETSAAVDSAFNTLAQTVLVQNARTLEDLVREMLRPMLKTWLDENLPGMVERMVRSEIERVSRGR
jgi:cell pole-organizing protein PopZ